jgi:hypothetical protein
MIKQVLRLYVRFCLYACAISCVIDSIGTFAVHVQSNLRQPMPKYLYNRVFARHSRPEDAALALL